VKEGGSLTIEQPGDADLYSMNGVVYCSWRVLMMMMMMMMMIMMIIMISSLLLCQFTI
jgi:hypothetical protein